MPDDTSCVLDMTVGGLHEMVEVDFFHELVDYLVAVDERNRFVKADVVHAKNILLIILLIKLL